MDSNHRPSAYEADELPTATIPKCYYGKKWTRTNLLSYLANFSRGDSNLNWKYQKLLCYHYTTRECWKGLFVTFLAGSFIVQTHASCWLDNRFNSISCRSATSTQRRPLISFFQENFFAFTFQSLRRLFNHKSWLPWNNLAYCIDTSRLVKQDH